MIIKTVTSIVMRHWTRWLMSWQF